jgi:DNA-binding NarL/FixJ family response regulator
MRSAILVEDHPAIQEALVAALEEAASVRVIETVATEAQAIWALDHRGDEADLVVLDVTLAEGTGMGVLKRRGAMSARCRVVVLTNGATAEVRRRCLALGADAVFEKAGEFEQFLAYCREAPSAA